MAAAATMAAAARELVLRAGASDVEEEEGPLVRTPGCFSGILSGRPCVRKTWAGFLQEWELGCYRRSSPYPSLGPECWRLSFPGHNFS